jgi:hypothetical protein
VSQMMTVVSHDAVASCLPSVEYAASHIARVCRLTSPTFLTGVFQSRCILGLKVFAHMSLSISPAYMRMAGPVFEGEIFLSYGWNREQIGIPKERLSSV